MTNVVIDRPAANCIPLVVCIEIGTKYPSEDKLILTESKSQFFVKASYRAYIQGKWMILYVFLEEWIAKSIGSDPPSLP